MTSLMRAVRSVSTGLFRAVRPSLEPEMNRMRLPRESPFAHKLCGPMAHVLRRAERWEKGGPGGRGPPFPPASLGAAMRALNLRSNVADPDTDANHSSERTRLEMAHARS